MAKQVDLSKYAEKIFAKDDLPLFSEAAVAANAGALRAAYVMIWLSCAESLKRRFRESSKYDNAAGRILARIDSLEKSERSVDKVLLKEAREYGFISDYGFTVLSQAYDLRCVYGHPYREAPSQEQVMCAAASVVSLVLSQPVKLRYGFGKRLLNDMLGNSTYLDDQQTVVADFAKRILPRVDESIRVWMLTRYWEALEKLVDDPTEAPLVRRGIWFCRTMLLEVSVHVFDSNEWHDLVSKFPKTLMNVCTTAEIFSGIGQDAQDSLIGEIFKESSARSSVLVNLEDLSSAGMLSDRQNERFTEYVSHLALSDLQASRLRTKTSYPGLIRLMKTMHFTTQNSSIDLFKSNGPEQAAELTAEERVIIGRNILQAGHGGAWSAIEFLKDLADGPTLWPTDIVLGAALECFINEDMVIRAKTRHLLSICAALDTLDDSLREKLVATIAKALKVGNHERALRENFDTAFEKLNAFTWARPLVGILNAKFPPEDQEEI